FSGTNSDYEVWGRLPTIGVIKAEDSKDKY
ncbi:MAG: hypothetical protein G01um101444_498, partial [Parcubacteria group bacterium Gr01-1014_44]